MRSISEIADFLAMIRSSESRSSPVEKVKQFKEFLDEKAEKIKEPEVAEKELKTISQSQ